MGGLGLFDYNEELESCDVSSRLNFVFVRLNFVFCSCSLPWSFNLSQSYSQVDDLIPDDFPRGPWLSAEDAKLEINLYCINPLTGGGGWAVSWHGLDTKYYSPASSHWRRIRCANRHDPAGKGHGCRPGIHLLSNQMDNLRAQRCGLAFRISSWFSVNSFVMLLCQPAPSTTFSCWMRAHLGYNNVSSVTDSTML